MEELDKMENKLKFREEEKQRLQEILGSEISEPDVMEAIQLITNGCIRRIYSKVYRENQSSFKNVMKEMLDKFDYIPAFDQTFNPEYVNQMNKSQETKKMIKTVMEGKILKLLKRRNC